MLARWIARILPRSVRSAVLTDMAFKLRDSMEKGTLTVAFDGKTFRWNPELERWQAYVDVNR